MKNHTLAALAEIKGLTLDPVTTKAIITKELSRKMGIIGSPEFEALLILREKGFTIENRTANANPNKYSHKGWTVSKYREYVEDVGTAEMLVKYDNIIAKAKDLSNGSISIGTARKIFLELFPNLTAKALRDYIESEKATFKLIKESEDKKVLEYPNPSVETAENQA